MTCLGCVACMDPRGTVGMIYKEEEYYTSLQTKYESTGPCGFGEEDVFLCFSNCKSMGAIDPPPPQDLCKAPNINAAYLI